MPRIPCILLCLVPWPLSPHSSAYIHTRASGTTSQAILPDIVSGCQTYPNLNCKYPTLVSASRMFDRHNRACPEVCLVLRTYTTQQESRRSVMNRGRTRRCSISHTKGYSLYFSSPLAFILPISSSLNCLLNSFRVTVRGSSVLNSMNLGTA